MPQHSNTNRVQHNLEQHLSKLNTDRKAHSWGCLYSLPTQNLQAFAGSTHRYSVTSVNNGRHLPQQDMVFSCRQPAHFTFPGARNQGTSQQVCLIFSVHRAFRFDLPGVCGFANLLAPVQGLHAISQLATYKAPVLAPSHAAAPSGRGLALLMCQFDTLKKHPVLYMETVAVRCGYTVVYFRLH